MQSVNNFGKIFDEKFDDKSSPCVRGLGGAIKNWGEKCSADEGG